MPLRGRYRRHARARLAGTRGNFITLLKLQILPMDSIFSLIFPSFSTIIVLTGKHLNPPRIVTYWQRINIFDLQDFISIIIIFHITT
ncbi:hypothetical protein HMPREF3164_05765 [Rothia sp. HMSC08A08]|nr:hypothetical protein HMPREF3016_00480 [Rothia sp. HMSC065D02]OFS80263.1 hypothetical protein HMPREF3164_05765 [Rothia sp. HMSC08A08]